MTKAIILHLAFAKIYAQAACGKTAAPISGDESGMPLARSHEVCLQLVFALLVAMHTDFMQKTYASEARQSLRRGGSAQVLP